jgi:hypothetical protein
LTRSLQALIQLEWAIICRLRGQVSLPSFFCKSVPTLETRITRIPFLLDKELSYPFSHLSSLSSHPGLEAHRVRCSCVTDITQSWPSCLLPWPWECDWEHVEMRAGRELRILTLPSTHSVYFAWLK